MVTGKFSAVGGIGRYTNSLVQGLRKHGIEVHVICEKSNATQDKNLYKVIEPGNYNNSKNILSIMQEISPELVHVQYEPSVFDLGARIIGAQSIKGSTLRQFYLHSNIPTVTTLHTVIPHEEYWDYVGEAVRRKEGKFAFLPLSIRGYIRRWIYGKNYRRSFDIARLSSEVINASRTSYELIGKGKIVYNAAEPAFSSKFSKSDLRKQFGLPLSGMLLLASGYAGSAKGFDILSKLDLPPGWAIVAKQTSNEPNADNHYGQNVTSLPPDYIDDESLSKLIHACDAVIIPRTIAGSSSGVLFDGLAHGLPFVATNLKLFQEFADMELGVVAERDPRLMSAAIGLLASRYDFFKRKVEEFIPLITYDSFALKHIEVYTGLLSRSV